MAICDGRSDVCSAELGACGRFGTGEQKEAMLGGILTGSVEAIAMSEPEAGSAVGNLSCKAVRQNGEQVINAQKPWVSEAHPPDHIPHGTTEGRREGENNKRGQGGEVGRASWPSREKDYGVGAGKAVLRGG
mgnify:CR=1 FL=1